jgi:recombination DNA repair RAD52 pathway protein
VTRWLRGLACIDIANDILGFDNWDAETTELLHEHEPVHMPPSEEHPKGGDAANGAAAGTCALLRRVRLD